MAQTQRAPHQALTTVWQLDENGLDHGAPVRFFLGHLQPVPRGKDLRFLSDDHAIPDDPRSGADQQHNG